MLENLLQAYRTTHKFKSILKPKKMSVAELLVLAWLTQNEYVSTTDALNLLGIERPAAMKLLRELAAQGLLQESGDTWPKSWELTTLGKETVDDVMKHIETPPPTAYHFREAPMT